MISGVSCVVLAGGESRRMGRDKAQVKLAGSSLLERVLKVVYPLFDDVMLSRRDKKGDDKKGNSLLSSERKSETVPFLSKLSSFLSVRIIEDQLPGRGPAIGLCAALGQAKHPYVFAIACDMPFISSRLVESLVSDHLDYDVVVPVHENRLEPLCAVYSTACLEPLSERVRQGKRGLVSFIEKSSGLKVRRVKEQELGKIDPALRSFVDIDSLPALAEAETMLANVYG
jgi:molybdopterin-guanine dinucleotide biosynthesis protein A